MSFSRSPWVRFAAAAAALGALFLGLRLLGIDFSHISKERMRETIRSLGVWGPVVYILIYVARPLIFFPAGILSAAAGFIWGFQGLVYLLAAANISSTLEFFFARSFGRGAFASLVKGRMLNLDEKIERHGFVTVLLIRLIPNVAWDIQNLSLGLTKVGFRDYFIATFIGIIPGSCALVFFGASLIETLSNPQNFWMMVAATAIFAGIYMLRVRVRRRREEVDGS
jgi:uncharacterized membrane protein YdjX (TVP38/TMEM64 family)